jgi:hypothetical protein
MKRLLAWIILFHRWTGVVFCLIFLVWFASGLVMVYHRMPEYTAEERLAHLAPLAAEDVLVDPSTALTAAGLAEYPQRAQLTTYGSRPVYRFLTNRGWHTVFADDGTVLERLTPEDAVGVAGDAFPGYRATARHGTTLSEPDQWTIGSPFRLTGPLHVVELGDAADTEVYVASATGEIALTTDRARRFWGYAGPVLHWFYFRPLRIQGGLWYGLIVYGSMLGLVLCLSGLIVGVVRVSLRRRYRQGTTMSPYVGWLRWHHYAGLVFGVVTFTFLFSGLLSMVPWDWSPGNVPEPQQVLAIRGGRINVDRFDVAPAAALSEFQREFPAREIEFRQFLGAPFYLAYAPEGRPPRSLLVSAIGGEPQVGELFNAEELLEAARAAMPDAAPVEAHWMTEYDAYYYAQAGQKRLPALRVTFNDPDRTWLYLDAHDGSLVQREVRRTRLERWIYRGLHSLDFPRFYQAAWAWYPAIVLLSIGGILLSITAAVLSWRVLRRA